MISGSLQIRNTENKGRGLFADEFIKSGTVIEVSPVLVMTAEDREHLEQTALRDYIFEWGPESDQCALALGYISVYNHSYNSNCEYFMDFDENIMFIKTVKDVAAGTELTLNYNGDFDNESEVWFEAEE